jgi:hypothetical protein
MSKFKPDPYLKRRRIAQQRLEEGLSICEVFGCRFFTLVPLDLGMTAICSRHNPVGLCKLALICGTTEKDQLLYPSTLSIHHLEMYQLVVNTFQAVPPEELFDGNIADATLYFVCAPTAQLVTWVRLELGTKRHTNLEEIRIEFDEQGFEYELDEGGINLAIRQDHPRRIGEWVARWLEFNHLRVLRKEIAQSSGSVNLEVNIVNTFDSNYGSNFQVNPSI